jgi:hypothetical protein
MAGYMTVSEVGRTAMGSASSELPLLVTQATSGAKSAMWDFSFSRAARETNMGKYTFSTPSSLIPASKKATEQMNGGREAAEYTISETLKAIHYTFWGSSFFKRTTSHHR